MLKISRETEHKSDAMWTWPYKNLKNQQESLPINIQTCQVGIILEKWHAAWKYVPSLNYTVSKDHFLNGSVRWDTSNETSQICLCKSIHIPRGPIYPWNKLKRIVSSSPSSTRLKFNSLILVFFPIAMPSLCQSQSLGIRPGLINLMLLSDMSSCEYFWRLEHVSQECVVHYPHLLCVCRYPNGSRRSWMPLFNQVIDLVSSYFALNLAF